MANKKELSNNEIFDKKVKEFLEEYPENEWYFIPSRHFSGDRSERELYQEYINENTTIEEFATYFSASHLHPASYEYRKAFVEEVRLGYEHGLKSDQVALYSMPKNLNIESDVFAHYYTPEKMKELRLCVEHDLTKEQILTLCHPDYEIEQMKFLRGSYERNLTEQEVKLFAEPYYSLEKMNIIRNALEEKVISFDKIKYATMVPQEVYQLKEMLNAFLNSDFLIEDNEIKSYIGNKLNITTPENAKHIRYDSLSNLPIETLIIGDSVESINYDPCYNCLNLKEAVIGENVKTMDGPLFNYCPSLEKVTFKCELDCFKGKYLFDRCDGLKIVTVPSESSKKILIEKGNLPKGCEIEIDTTLSISMGSKLIDGNINIFKDVDDTIETTLDATKIHYER